VAAPDDAGERLARSMPAAVLAVLDDLHAAGHAAYVVGGSLRDALLGREPSDWDLATDALPERTQSLFRHAVYENRFGTVAVRRDGSVFEVTTFRFEHDYADFRRPHRVEFGKDIEADLARRDFTVNAMAWGRDADGEANRLVDPFDGIADLRLAILRAVADPAARFEEDALRMIRAVRLAAVLGFTIEAATLAAIQEHAPLVAHLSGERVGVELEKLLAAPAPSAGLRLMADTGLLAVVAPELAAQRGIPQNKVPGEDLWDHTVRTVDAAPASRPVIRLAALVHDLGKPSTLADGHFHHHEVVGARMAEVLLRRLRFPRPVIDDVSRLVRHHMFAVDPGLSDAGIRRFLRRIGARSLDALFELRRADDIGSGLRGDDPDLAAFRARLEAEVAAEAVLDRSSLAIDGSDLMRDLGLTEGPRLGRLLDALVERVIDDPALNDRASLLLLAQAMLDDDDRERAS
jgi:tRNA nucleotidyltransferase (CCA-adding enzyme)